MIRKQLYLDGVINQQTYPLVNKPPFIMDRSTINGPISILMLVYQRVTEGPHPVVIIHEEMSDFPWNQLLGGSERFLVWHRSRICLLVPSGKHTNNYGTSSFLVGKSTISMALFNSCVSLPKYKWMKLNIRISLRLLNGHVPWCTHFVWPFRGYRSYAPTGEFILQIHLEESGPLSQPSVSSMFDYMNPIKNGQRPNIKETTIFQ